MTDYDWFLVFNQAEFLALSLVSKEYILNLAGIGEKTILVTNGNYVSIQYEGVFLPVNMISENPFAFDGYAVFIADNDDVYLGIEVEA